MISTSSYFRSPDRSITQVEPDAATTVSESRQHGELPLPATRW
jgi:hypothetical protein